jgi:poly(3-hydroxybutyrate) depolymerase
MKILLVLASLSFTAGAADKLPHLNLQMDSITVSGVSSGGYMASQFHIAHSNWVKGAGIIAAGPYYCGRNSIVTALSQCVNKLDNPIPLAEIRQQAELWEKQGKLAKLDNLKESKVWLLHGTLDQKVASPINDALVEQYQAWAGIDNVQYINDKPFAHHFPTLSKGHKCDISESPYLGNCAYDAAGELLSFIAGPLNPRADATSGSLLSFNQKELGGSAAASLADEGYVYMPQSCQQGEPCKLHISFHGCNQNSETLGTTYAKDNGLNEWADNNHLVVLYPQTKNSSLLPLNPQGCWDWWGYTDKDYANQQGQQIQAVTAMAKYLGKK